MNMKHRVPTKLFYDQKNTVPFRSKSEPRWNKHSITAVFMCALMPYMWYLSGYWLVGGHSGGHLTDSFSLNFDELHFFFFLHFFSLNINYNEVITENSACQKPNCNDLLARNGTETNLNFQGVGILTKVSLSLSKNMFPLTSTNMKDITCWSEFIYFISFSDSIKAWK